MFGDVWAIKHADWPIIVIWRNSIHRDSLTRVWLVVCRAVIVPVRSAAHLTMMIMMLACVTVRPEITSTRSTNTELTIYLWHSSTNRTPSLCWRRPSWACCIQHSLGKLVGGRGNWVVIFMHGFMLRASARDATATYTLRTVRRADNTLHSVQVK